MIRLRDTLPALLATFVAVACGDSTTDPDPEVVDRVQVSPATSTIEIGATVQLNITVTGDRGSTLTGRTANWSSSSGAATVSSGGFVTGVSVGQATITATVSGVAGTAVVNVIPPPVASVDVQPSTQTIFVGDAVQVAATPRAQSGAEVTGATVTWTSQQPGVATVDNTGRVTGVAPGQATIDATSQGITGSATITVEAVPVATVEITPDATTLAVGQTTALSAAPLTGAGEAVVGCQITWSVDNTAIASISAAGDVTGGAAGTATATAAADCGPAGTAQGTADVTVVLPRVVSVAVGGSFACALVEDPSLGIPDAGDVYCWGANDQGQLGDGTTINRDVPTMVQAPDGVHFGGSGFNDDPRRRAAELLVAGNGHVCVVTTGDDTYCWGDNDEGQLGNGTRIDSVDPVAVQSSASVYESLSAGSEYNCAVTVNGAGECWGDNDNGELGRSNTVDGLTPASVNVAGTWLMIRAGDDHTCGINGTTLTHCWGDGSDGSIGNGFAPAIQSTPAVVLGPGGFGPPIGLQWIGVGDEVSCGVESGSEQLYCWGRNNVGQVGDGTVGTNRLVPTMVATTDRFESVFDASADASATACAIMESTTPRAGPAYCWGGNAFGQVGDGTLVHRLTPTALATSELFIHISQSAGMACGITADYELMCWGDDALGRLGNGPGKVDQLTPQFLRVPGDGS